MQTENVIHIHLFLSFFVSLFISKNTSNRARLASLSSQDAYIKKISKFQTKFPSICRSFSAYLHQQCERSHNRQHRTHRSSNSASRARNWHDWADWGRGRGRGALSARRVGRLARGRESAGNRGSGASDHLDRGWVLGRGDHGRGALDHLHCDVTSCRAVRSAGCCLLFAARERAGEGDGDWGRGGGDGAHGGVQRYDIGGDLADGAIGYAWWAGGYGVDLGRVHS
jgi:hypothetical protein